MSPRTLAFIGCRLLALYFLYAALHNIPYSLFALSSAFGGDGPQGLAYFYEPGLWLSFASPILSLVLVLVLWFGAGWLSRELVQGAPEEAGELLPRPLLSVGVVLLGLTLASLALWDVVFYLLAIADGAGESDAALTNYLIAHLLQLALGVGFVLGAGRIVEAVSRLRRW